MEAKAIKKKGEERKAKKKRREKIKRGETKKKF